MDFKKIKDTKVLLITTVIIILSISSFFIFDWLKKSRTENEYSIEEIEERIAKYLKESIPDMTASISDISQDGDLYRMILEVGGQEYISYSTKDGRLLFPSAIDIDEFFLSLEVPKAVRPDIKLFVMSYCPYGLQSQKALLPAWELLKGKADFGVYFVDYIMHEKKEVDENLRQYCIQKQESERYLSYLSCFVVDGDFDGCLESSGVDIESLNSCIAATDKQFGLSAAYEDKESWLNGVYPVFALHSNLNQKYEVAGSPTLVINDKVIEMMDRSPEGVKELICKAFETEPEECSQILSGESASSDFGMDTGGLSGSCE